MLATWVLVVANAALCVLTWRGAGKQSRDMRDSIAVSERAAEAARLSADAASRSADPANNTAALATRQRREELERDTNRAAHPVTATAARIDELAGSVPGRRAQLLMLSGRSVTSAEAESARRKMELRQQRTAELITIASQVLGSQLDKPSDAELAADIRRMDAHLVQLQLMKEDVTGELQGIEEESRIRRQENASREAAIIASHQPG